MPVDVVTEIVIGCSPETVAAYSANPDNAPEWYQNITSVEWRTSPPLALGSRIAFVAHFLGRRMSYVYEVVDLAANRRLVMRTRQGPFPMETTYSWEPGRGREDAHDASKSRQSFRLFRAGSATHGAGHPPGKSQGPQTSEDPPGRSAVKDVTGALTPVPLRALESGSTMNA